MKKLSLIAVILGAMLLLAGGLAPFLLTSDQGGAIGIIGGADLPTLELILTVLLSGRIFPTLLIGASLIVSGVVYRILAGTTEKGCTVGSTMLTLSISASGVAGVYCALSYLSCFFMTHPDRYPQRVQWSVWLGLGSLYAFVSLLYGYVIVRKRAKSAVGVLVDMLMALVWALPFFSLCSYGDQVLSKLI